MTIPPDVITTNLRPDLAILNWTQKTIFLLELTCSFESNFEAANIRKTTKYSSLQSDLEDSGFKCHLIPFETGSRGHISIYNKSNLLAVFMANKLWLNVFKCIREMSRNSLLCSFSIFHAYTQPIWSDPPFLRSWSLFWYCFDTVYVYVYMFVFMAYGRLYCSSWCCLASKDLVLLQ